MRITHVITRLIIGGAQENTIDSVRAVMALAENASLGCHLGLQGQKWVQQHFSIEQMIDELYRLYERLRGMKRIQDE